MKKKKRKLYKFDVVTLFPEACRAYVDSSILLRAQKKRLVKIEFSNPREFTSDKHRTVDGRPFGGGPGMVMMAEPILKAVNSLKGFLIERKRTRVILLSARGKPYDWREAERLATNYDRLVLIAGRYEGIDERVLECLADEDFSVGNYILTGGELPALSIIDSVCRFIPGVLGKEESLEGKRGMYPVYTKPRSLIYKGRKYDVPEILMSGHAGKIKQWRDENGHI